MGNSTDTLPVPLAAMGGQTRGAREWAGSAIISHCSCPLGLRPWVSWCMPLMGLGACFFRCDSVCQASETPPNVTAGLPYLVMEWLFQGWLATFGERPLPHLVAEVCLSSATSQCTDGGVRIKPSARGLVRAQYFTTAALNCVLLKIQQCCHSH